MSARPPDRDTTRDLLYEEARAATLALVRIPSVSPGAGELLAAQEVLRLLHADGLQYDEAGLEPLSGDQYGRANAYAVLLGSERSAVVLMGHIDTVGVDDYGALAPWATEPEELQRRVAGDPGWMMGRGVADMKSGVAATIAVLRAYARVPVDQRRLTLVLIATPDEENESAGILAAIDLLLALRQRHGLRYLGAMNTDYTTARYEGDPHRYIYAGSVGKLLLGLYVVGLPAHAGAPFDGVDANVLAAELVTTLSLAPRLAERVRGRSTAPPVTLRLTDLKQRYDTQLATEAYIALNLLTMERSPGDVLDAIRREAQGAMDRALFRLGERRSEWGSASTDLLSCRVLSYQDLRAEAEERCGPEAIVSLVSEADGHELTGDLRERSLAIVRRLFAAAELRGPAVVVYFAPPYYPSVSDASGVLSDAARAVARSHPELSIVVDEFFPLLSDVSYLRAARAGDAAELMRNMPAYAASSRGYTLPFEAMARLDMPGINIGPYGFGVHQPDERVDMEYAFGTVPRLLMETVEQLARTGQASD